MKLAQPPFWFLGLLSLLSRRKTLSQTVLIDLEKPVWDTFSVQCRRGLEIVLSIAKHNVLREQ
jgi:hypothetical protein